VFHQLSKQLESRQKNPDETLTRVFDILLQMLVGSKVCMTRNVPRVVFLENRKKKRSRTRADASKDVLAVLDPPVQFR